MAPRAHLLLDERVRAVMSVEPVNAALFAIVVSITALALAVDVAALAALLGWIRRRRR